MYSKSSTLLQNIFDYISTLMQKKNGTQFWLTPLLVKYRVFMK